MTRQVELAEIGQISIPVHDVERATAFYRDQLGMRYLFTAPPGWRFSRVGVCA
ncbi:MAG TPA: VOC family protein [bacterium]|nr:VOC family protein [bacterium]